MLLSDPFPAWEGLQEFKQIGFLLAGQSQALTQLSWSFTTSRCRVQSCKKFVKSCCAEGREMKDVVTYL